MAGKFPRAANLWLVALIALAALLLPACERSLDFSDWNTRPLVATRIEVRRWRPLPGDKEPRPPGAPGVTTRPATQPGLRGLQVLTLDLETGRALFTDVDGKSYPQQLDPDKVQKIHDGVARGAWNIGTIKPALKAERPVHYSMTVYSGSQPFKDLARWSVPPHDPLPQCDTLLVETFDEAVRLAHPVSERVNLLK